MTNRIKVKQPNAAVFIYNYRDRLGSKNLDFDQHEVEQIILNTVSLKSVQTQKSKGNPAGAFEIRLAPTKNWVTEITPGSWCVILMSNEKIIDDTAKYGRGRVDERSYKMLGRIESVRGVVNTNQTTGAQETEYIVTGSDWGVIFNSRFYVDPLNRAPNESAVGTAERFGYTEYLLKHLGYEASTLGGTVDVPLILKKPQTNNAKAATNTLYDFIINGSSNQINPPLKDTGITAGNNSVNDDPVTLPSSRDNIDFILSLWGRADNATSALQNESGLVAKTKQVFKIPNKLAQYMGFVDTNSDVSPLIAQTLQQKSGILKGDDQYTNKDPSAGIIDFSSILGENTIWQILTSNSNNLINELIPEMRFENGLPKMTLYNRIKPFAVNSRDDILADDKQVGDGNGAKEQEVAADFISPYKNVRKIFIDSDDVIMSSAGTNWRDRVNFVEVTMARTLFQENYSSIIKADSQFIDQESVGRDGLLSMMRSTTYVPAKEGIAKPQGVSAYKYLLKEWHFDTHKMLNGQLSLIGQDQYIQVGDNIMVESKVVNKANFNNNNKQNRSRTKTYLMAHVESINHSTTVDANGGRVFTTNITFVRGIITDVNGNQIVTNDIAGAVDQDTNVLTPSTSKNKQVIGTSGPLDPDRQKLKGN